MEKFDKKEMLLELEQLEFISKFILYDRFNLSKKKLRKKLKKLIHQIKNDEYKKYFDTDIEESDDE